MKTAKATKAFCSGVVVLAASAAVAFVSGGPHPGTAASLSAAGSVPPRAVCAKPGPVDFAVGPGSIWRDEIHIPRDGFVVLGTPLPGFFRTATPTVVFSEIFAGGYWNHIGLACKRAADQVPMGAVGAAAVLPARAQLRCSFPQGLEFRQRWNGRQLDPHTGTTFLFGNGVSRNAIVVVKMGYSVKTTYNSHVCHRVPFGSGTPMAANAVPTGTTTTTASTETTPGP